jgi:hypothetical protein
MQLAQPLKSINCQMMGVDSILLVTELVFYSLCLRQCTITHMRYIGTQTWVVAKSVATTMIHPLAVLLSPPYFESNPRIPDQSRPIADRKTAWDCPLLAADISGTLRARPIRYRHSIMHVLNPLMQYRDGTALGRTNMIQCLNPTSTACT